MTFLEAVSRHIPSQRIPVAGYLRACGFTERQIEIHVRYFGFSEVSYAPDSGPVEQMVRAAAGLPGLHGREHHVRYVIQARTMPVVAPYPTNPLQIACAELGLTDSTAFCLTQHACASSLLAVNLAGQLLADDGDPDARALVLAGEKAFTSSARAIADTGIMGEGSAAVLVAPTGESDRVLSFVTQTYGEFYEGPWLSQAADVRFKEIYPKALAEVVLAAVESAGLSLDDIALVLPHNVNRMSWLRVLRYLGMRKERLFLDNLSTLGHCFGADGFINYLSACEKSLLHPGDCYIMTSVGMGATFSAMVFQH